MEHREQSPIPFLLQTSLFLSYLLHNSMSKELFGEASNFRNKKHEARRKKKIEREKLKGNLLILEMGVWKMSPPLCRGVWDDHSPPPPPWPQKDIRKLCFCLYRVLRKKARPSWLVQLITGFRKKSKMSKKFFSFYFQN